jgi:hypothetical protein
MFSYVARATPMADAILARACVLGGIARGTLFCFASLDVNVSMMLRAWQDATSSTHGMLSEHTGSSGVPVALWILVGAALARRRGRPRGASDPQRESSA